MRLTFRHIVREGLEGTRRGLAFAGYIAQLLVHERRIPKRIANSKLACLVSYPLDRLRNARKQPRDDAETIYLHLPTLQHRYLFQVLYFFSLTGHPLKLIRRETLSEYANLYQEGRLLYRIPNLKIVSPPEGPIEARMYVRSDGAEPLQVSGREREIIISDDFTRPFRQPSLLLPYAAHPSQYFSGRRKPDARNGHLPAGPAAPPSDIGSLDVERFRSMQRTVRIYFSGATWHYKDRGKEVARLFGKLTRLEALAAIRDTLSSDELLTIETPNQRETILHGDGFTNRLVLPEAKGPEADWLDDLSRSDFFVCLPGMTIPMCHSAVEAMAVGTIPILNYSEWFSPGLTDGDNCLTYRNTSDLLRAVRHALSLDEAAVRAMRKRVARYYDEHLDPRRIMQTVMASPANPLHLYLITERRDAYGPSAPEIFPSAAQQAPRPEVRQTPPATRHCYHHPITLR